MKEWSLKPHFEDRAVCINRLVPVPSTGTTTTLPKYRLLGLGSEGVAYLSEMAEYKYPNPSCSFVQFG